MSLYCQRSWFVYQSPSALSGAWGDWEKEERKTKSFREEKRKDREVLSTSLPHSTIPHSRLGLWLFLLSTSSFLSLSVYHSPVQLILWIISFCLTFLFQSISLSLNMFLHLASHSTRLTLSLHNYNSWGYNNISSVHQAQPALINKHFESTLQHRTELKMSPLCLCQYLSPCWQSYIRFRGGWLLQ